MLERRDRDTSETAAAGDSKGMSTKSVHAREAQHDVLLDATDSLGSHSGASTGHRDMVGFHNSMNTIPHIKKTICTC